MAQTFGVGKGRQQVALTVGLCFLVAVLEGFDIQAIGVAAPLLVPQLGLVPGQMGFVFAVSNIGLVIGASLGGWLADQIGRKGVFIASVAVFGSFTFLTMLADSYLTLLIVRIGAGLGFGAALPNMMAIAAEISAPDRRASTAAAMFCGMPLGGGVLALVTQVLPPDFDWRTLFMIGGVLPVLLVPALHFLMPETLSCGARTRSAPTEIWRTLFGEGRGPSTFLLWLAFLPTLVILYLILNWLPTLVAANGMNAIAAPQASLAFNFASVAGALFFGRLVDRVGVRWPLTLGYLALIVSLMALGASRADTLTLILSGATGFFLLGVNYALYGVAAIHYPQSMRGTGSGASIAVGRVGSIVGPLLAGMLLSAGTTASSVVQYMAPVAIVAAIAVFGLSFRALPTN